MNLFEKLNRLDDSLVESKRVVSESLVGRQAKPTNHDGRVLWNMPTLTVLRVAGVDENNTPRYYVRAEETGREYIADLRGLWMIDAATNPVTPKDLEDDRYDDDIDEMLTEGMGLSWLDVQNQIALEQGEGKNPFYDDSVAGNYVLELMGKVEKELNVEVVPSVQGGYGDVFIHVGNVLDNSEKIIDPIDFNKFSSDMINLVLESDTENKFVDNYRAEILAYID